MEGLRDEADKAKRECLEVKKIAEEKEVLFKQEQAALRKVRYKTWCTLQNMCEVVVFALPLAHRMHCFRVKTSFVISTFFPYYILNRLIV